MLAIHLNRLSRRLSNVRACLQSVQFLCSTDCISTSEISSRELKHKKRLYHMEK